MTVEIGTLAILLAAVAVVAIAVTGWLFFREGPPELGLTEAQLQSLLNMSTDTAEKIPTIAENWGDVARQSLKVTSEARTYCSRMAKRDSTAMGLPPGDDIVVQWRLDFVSPNRLHVTQEAWDDDMGLVYDEWVIIGKDNYQFSGLWSHTEDGRNAELNQRLLVDDLLNILRKGKPTLSEVFKYEDRRYLLFLYDSAEWAKVCREHLEVYDYLQGTSQIQIWIDLETHFLVKGAYLFETILQDGKPAHLEMHHVFVGHNEDVKVEPPPWINVESNSEGEGVISNTEVPILEHHP